MEWYKLVFKQKQPIHVGSAKWGVVKETEIFISGSTMWGALTNVYLQDKQDEINTNDENKLKEIGKYFETTSNFFPSFDGKTALQPTYQKGEFGYLLPDTNEFLSEDKFRFYFVDTLVQTAVEPISRKAKDESLHELDYILPKPKQNLENFKDNLYWIGIIQIEDNKKEFLEEHLTSIFVGADVRYGYGELELINAEKLKNNYEEFWLVKNTNNDNNDDDDNNNIEMEIKTKNPSPYFIEVEENLEIEGEIFLIPEIDFRENTPKLTDAKFFASIGSEIKNSSEDFELSKGKLIIKENQNANST